ncbi:unnamed protein product [Adineta steineri]|uniref:BAH domain-containing protein n=1 Tax=Adineta steineri TaxID=433720 RepID=A0A814H8J8_9BILA|nr:unnamed protein product [Adineta steineri]CAF1006399.1 unnamed protein product [Adineta steineri]
MPQRTRSSKIAVASPISPSKSKKKTITISNKTSIKKSSPTKRHLEQNSSILTQPRQKRLSSLTAAALVHYCTSILSPSRKLNHSTKSLPKNTKSPQRKRQISNVSSRSDIKHAQIESNTRVRREASSRASAMIMQQNEIERSRYTYSFTNKTSTTVIRPNRAKSTVINKSDIPQEQPSIEPIKPNIPSITTLPNQIEYARSSNTTTTTTMLSNSKYSILTEASLAEHNRLNATLPSYHTEKHDNFIKWTQELALCGRLSSHENSSEPIDHTTDNESSGLASHSNIEEIPTPSIVSNELSHSIKNNITTPAFLFPSTAYPLDIHSFYPLLPCWQYPAWSYQSSTSLIQPLSNKTSLIHSKGKIKKAITFNTKQKAIVPIDKDKEALTLHLHTHHHHHIHNSTSSLNSSNRRKTKAVLSSPQKTKDQFLETTTIIPVSVNNVVQREDEEIPLTTEYQILNLSINNKTNLNQQNETIKKTTRRKSSPVKRRISSGAKSNSSSIASINNKTSPKKKVNTNPITINSPLPNILNSNDNLPVADQKSSRRSPKRRSTSAATANSTAIVSITGKSSRGKRTNSASSIPIRSKTSINKKRSHSPASITASLPNKRKKEKVLNYWILSGKSEQQLVSIHADKPPVFRECYSSIQHVTEKDIIKSNDCVILRSETGTHKDVTPYLAKVKWFWLEPLSDEIQMSIIWYYHPEHAELPLRVKERFLRNELLASKYWDCVNVACIEDKCYVLNLNEYNRYCLREKSTNLFEHSEPIGQLKSLLNKNTSSIHDRPLPAKTVGNQNIFFCRYVYDYRVKRILKNPSLTNPIITTTANSITTAPNNM